MQNPWTVLPYTVSFLKQPHQLLTWNGLGILSVLFFQEEILPSLLLLSILR
jgi:hypothetical protein